MNVISRHAYSNPQEAAAWLASIEDEAMRGMASQQVASAWQHTDLQGAMNWVLNLPGGPARDDALLGLSTNLINRDEAVMESLVEQINDPEKRRQAYIMQVWNVARTDKERAISLLHKLELSDEERQQFEAQVKGMTDHRYLDFGVVVR